MVLAVDINCTMTTGHAEMICLLESRVLGHSVVSNSFVTLWTVACQAPLSMGFSRLEYWSELSFPSCLASNRAWNSVIN